MRGAATRPAVLAATALSTLALLVAPIGPAAPASALAGVPTASAVSAVSAAGRARPAVIGSSVIGHSVRGRALRAWHLGTPGPGVPTVVLVSTMHGDEARTEPILTGLRDGRPVHGVDLWVLPTYNPDGKARHTRQNARGVDLNRNYPASWRRVTGHYDSGSRPASEPETRAMMRFLRRVDPDYVVSFHQPLYGVDTLTKRPAFSRRLAGALRLPQKRFSCNGGCHGTMTMWFNAHFRGVAVTAEFGQRPSPTYLRGPITRGLLRLFGAHR